MDDQSYRLEQAADSILGDERLTDGLDDDTADFLLDWGLALATGAAADTGGIDEEEATDIMRSRMKATKRMLRHINDWLQNSNHWDTPKEEEKLSKIFIIARLAYGTYLEGERMTNEEGSRAPGLEAFLSQAIGLEGNSIEKANELRELIEGNNQEITNG